MKISPSILLITTALCHTKPYAFYHISNKRELTFPRAMTLFYFPTESQPGHRVTISLNIGEQVELEVSFGSDKPLNVKTKVLLQVADNLYNETAIQVSGEAYQEVVSMSNISRSLQEVDAEDGDEGERNNLVFKKRKQKTFVHPHCDIPHYSRPSPLGLYF